MKTFDISLVNEHFKEFSIQKRLQFYHIHIPAQILPNRKIFLFWFQDRININLNIAAEIN